MHPGVAIALSFRIEQPDDAIVKVTLSGLCGSDLHAYRGLENFNSPYIMGHEFVGIVVALGSSYMNEDGKGRPALYSSLAIGDRVISPFTVSCAECLFCRSGFTSRCVESKLFGSPAQPGAQAQYVRVPKAGGTLLRVPDIASQNASVPDGLLLPLCDVLPTGYFAAQQALRHPNLQSVLSSSWLNMTASLLDAERTLAIAVVGLGPIGICALISLLDELSPLSITWVIVAIDPNSDRRQKASNMLSKWNTDVTDHVLLVSPSEAKEAFELRGFPDGCHAALEAVGNNDALRLSYSLIRPFGVISSVGTCAVHPHTELRDNTFSRSVHKPNISVKW